MPTCANRRQLTPVLSFSHVCCNRLGVTKIFFQADVLIALQTVKDRILLPYAVKIQKWWLRKQERIWEHKLVRCVLMQCTLSLVLCHVKTVMLATIMLWY